MKKFTLDSLQTAFELLDPMLIQKRNQLDQINKEIKILEEYLDSNNFGLDVSYVIPDSDKTIRWCKLDKNHGWRLYIVTENDYKKFLSDCPAYVRLEVYYHLGDFLGHFTNAVQEQFK